MTHHIMTRAITGLACRFSLLFLALAPGIPAAETSWSEIIEGKVFEQGLKLEKREKILIRKCQITHRDGIYGIALTDCKDVRIEACVIRRIGNEAMQETGVRVIKGHEFVPAPLDHLAGIRLHNCRNVDIIGNEITDSASKGITITVSADRMNDPVNTLIESNRIAYIYDDGIDFNVVGGDHSHPNLTGVTIRNNLIHDIGLGLTRLGFARHGMYLSVRDAVVEGNTIYNCYYGEGISVRNSGVIRNNTVRNCARACISYWAQGNTTGSSGAVLIEGNNCRQDFSLPLPMRHIGFAEKLHQLPLGAIVIQHADNPKAKMKEIILRKNTLSVGADYAEDTPLIGGNGDPRKATAKLEISGNRLLDRRARPTFFANLPNGIVITNNETRHDVVNRAP
jgi:parallel beta-helix repeat protein